MAWNTIKPDEGQRIPGGITIWRYLFKKHGYDVPPVRSGKVEGLTIMPVPVHLLEECNPKTEHGWVVTSSEDLATKNIEELKMDGQIPHYILTMHSTWQILDEGDCWQRADGSSNGNTLGVALTMDDGLISGQYKNAAFNHSIMLVAYLLKTYKLTTKNIYITKNCPEFFTSRWREFKIAVQVQMKKL